MAMTLTMKDKSYSPDREYTYLIELFTPVTDELKQPSMKIIYPGVPYTELEGVRFEGQESPINITCKLKGRSVDAAGGTAPASPFSSGVKTVQEQRRWLKDYIFSYEETAQWYLSDTYWFPTSWYAAPGIPVMLDSILFTGAGTETTITARLAFTAGETMITGD